ncbi:nuclease-related domain-containing protein [Kitasatospora sp. NPDC056138]|uniref:nuclease-related domain-containing protein n=1 Tax=Kitasatospora sp. NPDC056138 TaxID=3345724 RepID=UPI0035E36F58
MEELTVKPWRVPGKDRLYVNRPGVRGDSVAWLDCQTGTVTIDDPGYEAAALALIESWCRTCGRTIPPRVVRCGTAPRPTPVPALRPPAGSPVLPPLTSADDLAGNRPGAGMEGMLRESQKQYNRVVRLAARLTGQRLGDPSILKGLDGEKVVGACLERLKPAGWRVLHGIPLPTGSDIDHVVIGPPGVFTVNSKHHPDASVWVGDGAMKVNRSGLPYLQNSEFEAGRTAKLLSHWCGFDVPVRPVIALVGTRKITHAASAPTVDVIDGEQIAVILPSRPPVLTPGQLEQIYAVARHRYVWSRLGRRPHTR